MDVTPLTRTNAYGVVWANYHSPRLIFTSCWLAIFETCGRGSAMPPPLRDPEKNQVSW